MPVWPYVPQWTTTSRDLVWRVGNDSRVTHTHENVMQYLPKKQMMIVPVGIGPNLPLYPSSEPSAVWQTTRITSFLHGLESAYAESKQVNKG